MFNLMLSFSAMFCGTFRSKNNLTCQKITFWKADEIVVQSDIVLKEVADDIGTNIEGWRKLSKPGDFQQHRES